MEEITWKIEDLGSKSTILTKDLRCGSLTLDLTRKTVCKHCKKELTGSYCCGYSNYNSNKTEVVEVKATIKHNGDLIDDLKKALLNENFSDFTFIIDEEMIPVSKIILAARSPVFERMFNSEFKEKSENQQTLESTIPKEAFKELIRYIYTNEVCELPKHVFDLLHASDFYQVESLKSICEEEMLKILCESNANKIFQSAHLYRCSDALKQTAFVFIQSIFQTKNYDLPQEFINNPSKVAYLFEIKNLLEDQLRPTINEQNIYSEEDTDEDTDDE